VTAPVVGGRRRMAATFRDSEHRATESAVIPVIIIVTDARAIGSK